MRAGGQQDPVRIVDLFPDLPASIHRLDIDDDAILYSRVRNLGAASAVGEHLAFCDADTIATRSFVASVHRALDGHDAIVSGEVLYLPPVVVADRDVGELVLMGRPHPARRRAPMAGVRLDARHELVWGLCMAMRRSTFERAGGFDEQYGGYAGPGEPPVAATNRGAIASFVNRSVAVMSTDETAALAAAIDQAARLNRDACRRHAATELSDDRMVESYLTHYRAALAGRRPAMLSARPIHEEAATPFMALAGR